MTTPTVRTRIAPSPTGFLHLGTARTALYSWAYARHFGGEFVLRIEDTDVARSTQDSVTQILASMQWLGLTHDEGPIYQMQRLARYREVIDAMLAKGQAYWCWATPDELDTMREAQRARGEKPRYDGRWRPAPGKTLPPPPAGVAPVVRFCNPPSGDVTWIDLVKGPITINNQEIDDLIILRPAPSATPDGGEPSADARQHGVPTYNFAVVVDDMDMRITHVFRGDEHINNTPWQINLFAALGAAPPHYGHCPIILGDDGQKLSKRRGAVSVTAYDEAGYLPEAMLNYLARLGWSHGDEELFTAAQMVQWFDGTHLSKSPAQWDPAKLAWVNAQYLRLASNAQLVPLVSAQIQRLGLTAPDAPWLERFCALFKDRCDTTVALAQWAARFQQAAAPSDVDLAPHRTDAVRAAVNDLREHLGQLSTWDAATISAAMRAVLATHQMKMPQLAVPVRLLTLGLAQTPAIDAVLALLSRSAVQERLHLP
jgi:glutamyl-tRNA synthetase